VDSLYVLARKVLLDALEATGPHRGAAILVGAHAIYHRVGEADIAVAPFTTDGDLAIDPEQLADEPPLDISLVGAGFVRRSHDVVGSWVKYVSSAQLVNVPVMVDFLVPQTVSPGRKHRGARLPGHDPLVARSAYGIEDALVDADFMEIGSLEPGDSRSFRIRVAGPAALLVSKLHKIADRVGSHRGSDKDGLDVLRLLRGTPTDDMSRRFRLLLSDGRSKTVAEASLEYLTRDFARPGGIGVVMTVRATTMLADPAEMAASCVVLSNDLLDALMGPT